MIQADAIQTIFPFKDQTGQWVFSDPATELENEELIAGVPDFIEAITADIPDADQGFALSFSSVPFDGYQVKLDFVCRECGGCWYRGRIDGKETECWFCQSFFRYYSDPPAALYAQAETLKKSRGESTAGYEEI